MIVMCNIVIRGGYKRYLVKCRGLSNVGAIALYIKSADNSIRLVKHVLHDEARAERLMVLSLKVLIQH